MTGDGGMAEEEALGGAESVETAVLGLVEE
jgi:hypothetical protein